MVILGGWVFLMSEVPLLYPETFSVVAAQREIFIVNLLVRIH